MKEIQLRKVNIKIKKKEDRKGDSKTSEEKQTAE
jgi:hypothetical protein